MSKVNFEEMQNDVKAGLYEILDDADYGDFKLDVLHEQGFVTIVVRDMEGKAVNRVTVDEFLALENWEAFDKLASEILHYCYIQDYDC